MLIAPGAYDALSAKLIEQSGFEAVYNGGYAAVASGYGAPDLGLLGLAEMTDLYARVRRAVDLPMIADADAGYGGLLNVARTIEELATIGIDVIQLEDQEHPKQCGHLEGKTVVPFAEAVTRVEIAVDVAGDDGPAILARTDALQEHGVEEALRRANAFLEVGATAILIDAPSSLADVRAIGAGVDGPLVFNGAGTGRGPELSPEQLGELGFAAVVYPIETLYAGYSATKAILDGLRERDEIPSTTEVPRPSFDEVNALLGLPEMVSWEQGRAERINGSADQQAIKGGRDG